jgi:hypothetical protein
MKPMKTLATSLIALLALTVAQPVYAAASVDSTPTSGLSFIDIDDAKSILTKSRVISFGEKLYIEAGNGSGDLWYETDGTVSGTKGATGFGFNEYPNLYEEMAELDGKLYFNAQRDTGLTNRDFRVMEYDGVNTPTTLTAEIRGGVVAAAGNLYAGVENGNAGIEYPLSESTDNGSTWSYVCQTDSTGNHAWGDIPTGLTSVGDRYVFASAQDQANADRELWVYDTQDSTCDYFDVNSNTGVDSGPRMFTPLGDDIYFVANDASGNHKIYKYDGSGVTEVIDPQGDTVSSIDTFDSKLVFSAGTNSDTGIFTSAGDQASVTKIVDVSGIANAYVGSGDENNGRNYADNLTEFRGELYFSLATSDEGAELWRFDGTNLTQLVGLTGTGTFVKKDPSLDASDIFNPFIVSPLGLAFEAANGTNQGIGLYDPEYGVTYNANGGSGTISGSNSANTVSLSSGAGFEREGFSLSGWNTQADGNGTGYSLSASVTPANRLTDLFAVWSQVQLTPAPYSGPAISGLKETKEYRSGERATFVGERLGSVSAASIGSIEASIVDVSNTQFTVTVPNGLTPGTYDLVIESTLGNLTYLDALVITASVGTTCTGESMSYWTTRISDNQAKVYIKCPQLDAKIRILHQTGGSGEYDVPFVKTITSLDDSSLVVNEFGTYIVRTIDLDEINRIRIRIGDDEVWKVRYNN